LVLANGTPIVGTLVFVVDRHPEFVYLLPNFLSLESEANSLFANNCEYLLRFIHFYAFLFMTVVVAMPSITADLANVLYFRRA